MFSDFISLLKPRILVMQFVSFSLGYGMAMPFSHLLLAPFLWGLAGTALISGGAASLNHSLEWQWDAKMTRTRNRPVPTRRISPLLAAGFGAVLIVAGLAILIVGVNGLTAFLGGLTAFLYVAVYTPSKRWHWINTYIGTLPGAILPLGGWVAATGSLERDAIWMALVLLVWQLPHFFAIAWMYREDYELAGFKMVSAQDPLGDRTVFHMKLSTWLLAVAGVLPYAAGLCGPVFAICSVLLSIWLLRDVRSFSQDRTYMKAKRVLKTSVYYLPLFLLAIGIDRWLG